MNFFSEHLEQINEISKKARYPNKDVLEKFLMSLSLAKELQEIDKRMVLHGGTATQLYLGKFQRASEDADILTSLSLSEVEDVIDGLREDSDFEIGKGHPNPRISFVRYLPRHPSTVHPGTNTTILLDITHSIKGEFKTENIGSREVLSCEIDEITTVHHVGLLPRKLFTLNFDYCGLPEKNMANVAKHTYDAYCLINTYTEKELIDSFKQFEPQCDVEYGFHTECCIKNPRTCLESIVKEVHNLTKIDYPVKESDIKEIIRDSYGDFNTILQQDNHKDWKNWAEILCEIEFLGLSFLKAVKDGDTKPISEFSEIKKEASKIIAKPGMLDAVKENIRSAGYPDLVFEREQKSILFLSKSIEIRGELF